MPIKNTKQDSKLVSQSSSILISLLQYFFHYISCPKSNPNTYFESHALIGDPANALESFKSLTECKTLIALQSLCPQMTT